MKFWSSCARPAALALVLLGAAGLASAAVEDPSLLAGLKARSIGPAAMSGRIGAIDAVPSNPAVVYVGAASGGVWKTDNAGVTWTSIFDREAVHSIGAIAIDPQQPETVWVGTGEGNVRNSVSIGRGVYLSRDGGKSWRSMGLTASERIHRIVVHPQDSDTVYVAAMGPLWSAGGERGVYRSRDGGRSWQLILAGSDGAGASDLIMDPHNPNLLYASMWQFRRTPHSFKSGGPGSGLYRSTDGGDSWTRLNHKDGLPAGDLGRIALAVAPSDPNIVYALVEAAQSALLRSTDRGLSFSAVNEAVNVHPRPFYFSDLRVDPERPDRLYKLAVVAEVSNDGGKNFETLIGWDDLHPDHHALWVHPQDGRILINGNDGGVGFSSDRGATWRYAANLPLSQFYHVRHDMETPYNVYGGLQDNGSWKGPAAVWETGGIQNHHWVEVNFGDGFDTAPDPSDPLSGYAMSQEGYLVRYDLRTGMRKLIRPAPQDEPLRFHWNAALALDPHDPKGLYFGSQFVHYSADRGENWRTLSPDLSTDNPEWQKQADSGGLTPDVTGAENRTTIIAIAPSPVQKGVIWVGTDDGRVQLSQDGGGSWQALESKLPKAPKDGAYVPHIHPSSHAAGRAFLVLDNHRNGDFRPYAYRIDDFGRSVRSLVTPAIDGYAYALIEDPVEPRLLFLGTELGLWASTDAGASWFRYTHGLPTAVSVMDLAIHPREHDLIIGTHGRGIYIVDDLRPLRALAAGTPSAPLTLLAAGDGILHYVSEGAGARFPGNGDYAGENEPSGAMLSFYVNDPALPHPVPALERERAAPADQEAKAEKVVLTIRDANGALVRRVDIEPKQGLNRWVWDLGKEAARSPAPPPPWAVPSGPPALPGSYALSLRYGEHEVSGQVQVHFDPRLTLDAAALAARSAALERAERLQNSLVEALSRFDAAQADIASLKTKAEQALSEARHRDPAADHGDSHPLKVFIKRSEEASKALDEASRKLWQNPDKVKGYTAPTAAFDQLGTVQWMLASSFDAPTAATQRYFERAEVSAAELLSEAQAVLSRETEAIRTAATQNGLALLPSEAPVVWPEQ